MRTLKRSAVFPRLALLMMTDKGLSCAPVAELKSFVHSDRGPRTSPSSSWMMRLGDRPKAVFASALNARYRVPNSAQRSVFAVSCICTVWNRSGLSLIMSQASLKIIPACSRLWAAEYNSAFGRFRAGGPQRWASTRQAARVDFEFFRPMEMVKARREFPYGIVCRQTTDMSFCHDHHWRSG